MRKTVVTIVVLAEMSRWSTQRGEGGRESSSFVVVVHAVDGTWAMDRAGGRGVYQRFGGQAEDDAEENKTGY
jgi:hypothetical protein